MLVKLWPASVKQHLVSMTHMYVCNSHGIRSLALYLPLTTWIRTITWFCLDLLSCILSKCEASLGMLCMGKRHINLYNNNINLDILMHISLYVQVYINLLIAKNNYFVIMSTIRQSCKISNFHPYKQITHVHPDSCHNY